MVGFALEDKNLRANAEKKLKEKNLDMIIANTPDSIGSVETTVQIKLPDSAWLKIKNAPKTTIAREIIRTIESLRH